MSNDDNPLGLAPPRPVKQRHRANPVIWAACGGIFGAVAGTIASLSGQLPSGQTVFGFTMGGIFWVAVCAQIWNWLGDRKL